MRIRIRPAQPGRHPAPWPRRAAPTGTGPASALGVPNPSRGPKFPPGSQHARRRRAAPSSIWICSAPPRSRSLAGAPRAHPALAPAGAPASAQHQLTHFYVFIFLEGDVSFSCAMEKIYLRKAPAPPAGTGLRELSGQSRTPLPPDNTQPCFARGLRDLNTRAGRGGERGSPDRRPLCPPGRLPASAGAGFRGSRQRPVLPRGRAHAGGDGEGPPAPSGIPSRTLVPPQGEAKGSAQGRDGGAGWGGWEPLTLSDPHPKGTHHPELPRDTGDGGSWGVRGCPRRRDTAPSAPVGRGAGQDPETSRDGDSAPSRRDSRRQGVCWALREAEGDFPAGEGSLWETAVGGKGRRRRKGKFPVCLAQLSPGESPWRETDSFPGFSPVSIAGACPREGESGRLSAGSGKPQG